MAFPNAFLRIAFSGIHAGLLALVLVAGCHSTPCGACPSGTVCELDGTCRTLAPRRRSGFARAERLRAVHWGGTRGDRRRDGFQGLDELLLGGDLDATIHLAFELPEGEILAAVLTLYPAPRAHARNAQTVRTYRTTSFGADVSRAIPPRRIGRFGSTRRTSTRADRPLRVDVTRLVRNEPRRRVHLGVDARRPSGLPWRIASPTAENDSLHPHLDVRVR